jgi:hypothetical protein
MRGRGGEPAAGDTEEDRNKKILDSMKFSAQVKGGSRRVQVYFVPKTAGFVEDLFDPSLRREPYRAGGGEPRVSSLTITGPQPETAAVADTPSRQRILVCKAASSQDEACAKRIISTLARRAYRRPVTDADLQAPLTSYRDGARRAGFESGIEMALRSILVSPKFLFRFEGQPAGAVDGTPYRISDLELASRLSFFLWSSVPDDELLDVREGPRQARYSAVAGTADAGGPALAGTGRQLRRAVAVHPQRGRPPAESGAAVSLRRPAAHGFRAGNEAVLREHRPREP